jgi:hypothetical protein
MRTALLARAASSVSLLLSRGAMIWSCAAGWKFVNTMCCTCEPGRVDGAQYINVLIKSRPSSTQAQRWYRD